MYRFKQMIKYNKNNKVVYLHKYPHNGAPYYVGIGNPDRPYNFERRSDFWKNTYNKYGVEVEVIHEGLTWEQACLIEIALIKAYGRRDIGTGCLVNMTDGGDGISGYKPTKEQNKANSERMKHWRKEHGQLPPMTGKTHSEETKMLMAENSPRKACCDSVVRIIRNLYKKRVDNGTKKGAVTDLAKQFNIGRTTVNNIVLGRTRKYVL